MIFARSGQDVFVRMRGDLRNSPPPALHRRQADPHLPAADRRTSLFGKELRRFAGSNRSTTLRARGRQILPDVSHVTA
jgi:hypothetical protein